jgi:propanol-preferring alcohol dehydrogenase
MKTTNGVAEDLPSKQKAAQYDPKDNSVHVREIPVPSIKPDELLVKVSSASLCHSDLMLFEPNEQGLILTDKPVTMGHEAVGRILEVGEGTRGFKMGDMVLLPDAATLQRERC